MSKSNPNVLLPTLYTPATTEVEKLISQANGYGTASRMVFCCEDSIDRSDEPEALANLEEVFKRLDPEIPTDVFVRVRIDADIKNDMLERVLSMAGVENITGIVIPKADPDTYPTSATLISQADADLRVMPILESEGMYDCEFRKDLRDVFMDPRHYNDIDCLRLGAYDLMGYQNLMKDKYSSVWDYAVIETVLSNIICEFGRGGAFTITAPVFGDYGKQYNAIFRRQTATSMRNGLFGQTVIHPQHVPQLKEMYKVTADELLDAQAILDKDAKGAQGRDGRMLEKAVMTGAAKRIMERSRLFGVLTDIRQSPHNQEELAKMVDS